MIGRWVVLPPSVWRTKIANTYLPAPASVQTPWIKLYAGKAVGGVVEYKRSEGFDVVFDGDFVVDIRY